MSLKCNDQIIKCQDCGLEFELNYSTYKDTLPLSQDSESNEDMINKIKKIEELTNFNIKKNICLNCFDQLIKERESSSNILESESNMISQALLNLTLEMSSKEFINVIDCDEEYLREKEKSTIMHLDNLKTKEKETEEELKKLYAELKLLCEQEKTYWEEFNVLERNIYLYEKDKILTIRKRNNFEKEIKKLSSANIINELFNISFYDKYGTINGSKMGLPKDTNIHMEEINAGWGYIVHLTTIIAKKVGYEFQKYELIPMGNYSKVLVKSNPSIQFEISVPMNQKIIDKANTAATMYLECLKELNEFILEKYFPNTKTNEGLLYKITNDSINNYSIKYDQANQEHWGKCMKYLLTILKSYINLTLKKEEEDYRKIIIEKAQII